MIEFLQRFHWSLFLRFEFTIFQHWFRWWLGADQATSHYLNQRWLVYWRIYASFGLNELIHFQSPLGPCYEWNKVVLKTKFHWHKKIQKCFIYNASNFINFRIKTCGIQMTNFTLLWTWWGTYLIAYDLSSHQNNLPFPVGKTGQYSRFDWF